MSKTRNFKSKEAYRKWLAYIHMRDRKGRCVRNVDKSVARTTPGHQRIRIKGRPHTVKHG